MLIRRQCILDTPCCFFAEELCKAYPEAKVILNTRDFDGWMRSMQETIFKVFRWPSWLLLRYTDPFGCGPWYEHVKLTWDVFCDGDFDNIDKCRRRFLEHYEQVRQVVPKHRLLEYRIKDGWDPLVEFLGLKNRSGAIPPGYGQVEFLEAHTTAWKGVMLRSAKSMMFVLLGLSGIVGAVSYLSM